MLRSRLVALLLAPRAFMLMGAKTARVDPDPVAVPAGTAAADVAKVIRVSPC